MELLMGPSPVLRRQRLRIPIAGFTQQELHHQSHREAHCVPQLRAACVLQRLHREISLLLLWAALSTTQLSLLSIPPEPPFPHVYSAQLPPR